MSFLLLENRQVLFSGIRNALSQVWWNERSRAVLDFCDAWLTGVQEFEIFTSGSTGTPKRITWSRELMQWSIQNTATALSLEKDMHALLCMDPSKAGGKMMLARALELGMSLEVIEPSRDPLREAQSKFLNFAAMVPLQLQHLIKENRLAELEKIEKLIIGGARLNDESLMAIQSIDTEIFATYGMTETASHIALQRLNGEKRQDAFHPLPGVKIQADENGCALIQTPFHHALHTHDLVTVNEDGSFLIHGRLDNMVNSGGIKISMEKVEDAIDKALTALKLNFMNFCAYKKSDPEYGEALIAIFEGDKFEEKELMDLRSELRKTLLKFEQPKEFYFAKKLAYTSSGKIDRARSGEIALQDQNV
jgi:O-succinylbenzoic acid--CoA ligase